MSYTVSALHIAETWLNIDIIKSNHSWSDLTDIILPKVADQTFTLLKEQLVLISFSIFVSRWLWLLSIQLSEELSVILKWTILTRRMRWILFGFICLEDLFCDFYRFDPVRFLRAPNNILFLYQIINSGVPIRWTTSAVDTQSTPYLLDCFLWVYGLCW